MGRRKQSSPGDQDYIPEFPTVGYLRRQLAARTREPRKRLHEAATAAELRAFWEERLENDLNTRETQTEALQYIQVTWSIMRRLFDQNAAIAPPPKPNIVRPLRDKTGVPSPPRSPAIRSNYYRCRAAYLDVNGEDIPVDELLLENAVDTIIAWCRQVESAAAKGGTTSAGTVEAKGEQEGPSEPYQFQWQGQPYNLEIDPAAWRLLKVVWGKPMIAISEVGEKLRKGKWVKYSSLKPAVFRLNDAMNCARLPFTWGKDRGQDYIKYRGPTIASSVST
jgi:hypothetical protein